MSWEATLAAWLDAGGPIHLCDDCGHPHAISVLAHSWRRPDGRQVLDPGDFLAYLARLEAILDDRRPDDCACRCCAPVTAENERLLHKVTGHPGPDPMSTTSKTGTA